jgi:nitrous oxidase accessory protein
MSLLHFKEYPKRRAVQWIGAGLLLVLIAWLAWWGDNAPLWEMHMKAPQYPNGLVLIAYGDHVAGNVTEVNLLNQYIGMKTIDPSEIKAMNLCPFAIGSIVLLAALAFIFPKFRWLFSALAMTIPIGMLATIQYYLYLFGHSLDPAQNIFRMEPFTPHVLGPTSVKNFQTMSVPGLGFWLLMMASLLIGFGNRLARSIVHGRNPFNPKQVAIPVGLLLFSLFAQPAAAQNLQDLQSTIDQAPAGSTLIIKPGFYRGPIHISKPLTIIGQGKPEVRGNGSGNVVTIDANNITFDGFLVRLSGKEVSDEPAGITVSGNHNTIRNCEVRDVYFGILATSGTDFQILNNNIHPGKEYGSRAGHAINVWNVDKILVHGNDLYDARDGVILTYAQSATVDSNSVTNCRYGLHSMYSKNLCFTRNNVHHNLLGVALMYTDSMRAEGNIVAMHQEGATPYGFLLKDLNNLEMHHNVIVGNRVGIYADGLSMQIGSSSLISENEIAANERGLSIMSNAAFDFSRNNVIDNLADVYNEGLQTSAGVHWTTTNGGNFWSEYHGYDKAGDGVGDLEYRQESNSESMLASDNPARAFIYTPAHLILDAAIRMFPMFRAAPALEDRSPRMKPEAMPWRTLRTTNFSSIPVALISSLIVLVSLWALWRWRSFAYHS